jgi:FkbM family methyltransferase
MYNLLRKLQIYGPTGFIEGAICEVKNYLRGIVGNSYSQKDEDTVIDNYFNAKSGFYVDVGAYDPTRMSNTKRLYKKGWRGINIEPNVFGYTRFLKQRPEDINLNMGVGISNNNLTFYRMVPDTLSTFSEEEKNINLNKGYHLISTSYVSVLPLKDILDKYSNGRKINFLSIDAEGNDIDVLKSNDWEKYKPEVICVESYEHSAEVIKRHDIGDYLVELGYEEFYDNKINSLYRIKIV